MSYAAAFLALAGGYAALRSLPAPEEGSVLGDFLSDLTSDVPSEGLGDILGLAGAAGLLAVAGGALAATTGLGDLLSGDGPSDPKAEVEAALMIRALAGVARAGGLGFAEKQALLDRVGRDDPRAVLAVTRALSGSEPPQDLAAEVPPDLADRLLGVARAAARADDPDEQAYVAALARALGR